MTTILVLTNAKPIKVKNIFFFLGTQTSVADIPLLADEYLPSYLASWYFWPALEIRAELDHGFACCTS